MGLLWGLAGGRYRYGVENGGLTLKPIEVQQPIPQDEAELNAKFEELVVSGQGED